MERAKEKLARSRLGCGARAWQRAVPNEANARKQAKRRQRLSEEFRPGYHLYDGRRTPHPPQPGVSGWELAERWEEAREKAGGLVSTDWHRDPYKTHGEEYTRRCVQWLNHDDEQKRMSALYSLHTFLSPLLADRDDENTRTRIDAVLAPPSEHSGAIAAHLRRCLIDNNSTTGRAVEEKLTAVMVAGLMGLWSPQSVGESGLLAALTGLATDPFTGDSARQELEAQARRQRRTHGVDHEDLRAACVSNRPSRW